MKFWIHLAVFSVVIASLEQFQVACKVVNNEYTSIRATVPDEFKTTLQQALTTGTPVEVTKGELNDDDTVIETDEKLSNMDKLVKLLHSDPKNVTLIINDEEYDTSVKELAEAISGLYSKKVDDRTSFLSSGENNFNAPANLNFLAFNGPTYVNSLTGGNSSRDMEPMLKRFNVMVDSSKMLPPFGVSFENLPEPIKKFANEKKNQLGNSDLKLNLSPDTNPQQDLPAEGGWNKNTVGASMDQRLIPDLQN